MLTSLFWPMTRTMLSNLSVSHNNQIIYQIIYHVHQYHMMQMRTCLAYAPDFLLDLPSGNRIKVQLMFKNKSAKACQI